MLIQLLAGAAAAVGAIVPMQCDGGDSPPSVSSSPTLRLDRFPQGATANVWGAEGYVSMDAGCSQYDGYDLANGGNVGGTMTVTSGDHYFGGGGDALNPGMRISVECNWFYPYIMRKTVVVYAWD